MAKIVAEVSKGTTCLVMSTDDDERPGLSPDEIAAFKSGCDHAGYAFEHDGRHCRRCGAVLTDFGD